MYEGEDEYVDEEDMIGMEGEDEESEQNIKIKEFTTEEIQSAIDRLRKAKAKDSSGVRAEQLKNASDETKEEIRTIFNEIAQQEDFTQANWRKLRIQVFYKKRRQRGCRQLQAKLWATNTIQAVRYGTLCSTRTQPTQNTAS